MGVKEPASLTEWANISLGRSVLPWLENGAHAAVERSVAYFLLHTAVTRATRRKRWLQWLRAPLRWRMKHQWFRWPVELRLAAARRWLVMRRSLLTGKSLVGLEPCP